MDVAESPGNEQLPVAEVFPGVGSFIPAAEHAAVARDPDSDRLSCLNLGAGIAGHGQDAQKAQEYRAESDPHQGGRGKKMKAVPIMVKPAE